MRCPTCRGVLWSGGKRGREVLGEGGQRIQIERTYARCQACGWAGFPLDRVLGLVSFGFTPRLFEAMVRLGSMSSFRETRELLSQLLRVEVSEATVRRATETAGRMVVAQEGAAAERVR